MNQSRFIIDTHNKYKLDFQKLWQESILCKKDIDVKRAVDDTIETKFWEKLAPIYDDHQTLYDYAKETFNKLLHIVGKNKEVIEIGCGTGKFTLSMAKHSKEILAIDFSKHMLDRLNEKIKKNHIKNIFTKWEKWENIDVDKVDVIYNVNAMYRMWNIKDSLEKMNKYAKEKVVLVWTLQRSKFHSIFSYKKTPGIGTISDYIHIQNILYELGIDANIEFLDIIKPFTYEKKEDIYEDFKKEAKNHISLDHDIKTLLNDQIEKKEDHFIFYAKLKVAFIYWKPIH